MIFCTLLVLNSTIIHNGNLQENFCSEGSSGHTEQTLIHVGSTHPDSLIFAHVQCCTFEVAVRDDLLVSVFSGPLAQLSSVKVALVHYFSCSELELRPRTAITLNKLERLIQETTHIREPWGPLARTLQLRALVDL